MGLSEEGDELVEQRYEELCQDLNMDRKTQLDAWSSYQKIRTNYTLEFFNKMKKWSDMANLSQEFRDKVDKLERNFAVSTVIFKKFEPIFLDIFRSPADEAPRQPRSRKQRKLPCSLMDVFNFSWTMFVQVKGNFPAISDDLVNSYHLLLCNIDWFYSNALLGGRKDLINPNFSGLPEGYESRDWKPPQEPPCIIKHLCDKHEGLELEAKVIKEHWWKLHLKKLFEKKILKGKAETLSSVLEIGNFEANRIIKASENVDRLTDGIARLLIVGDSKISMVSRTFQGLGGKLCIQKLVPEFQLLPNRKELGTKQRHLNTKGIRDREAISDAYEEYPLSYSRKAVNNEYEEYVLSVGDFDERIFLDNNADEEIGTPAKSREDMTGELSEKMQQKRSSLQEHFDQTRSLAPSTPLTGRRYLKDKDPTITPVSTATQSVSRLQHLLSGLKTAPSETLKETLMDLGGQTLMDTITQRIKDMGEIFCNNYVQSSENHPGSQLDFAKRRLQLGESLYYKTLESILNGEKKRSGNKDPKTNLTGLIEHEVFHRSLFACCLEIIIFSYNSQRMFPWIVEIFDLSPFHFYKVVEIIVREEDGLSRDVVKHLNHIEECILEISAWKSDSPLWDLIKSLPNGIPPSSAEVSLPPHGDNKDGKDTKISLRRIVLDRQTVTGVPKDPLLSPTGPSAADRFSSPSPGSAKRRLFSATAGNVTVATSNSSLAQQLSNTLFSNTSSSNTGNTETAPKPQHLVAFQQVITQDGRQVLIPVQTSVLTPPQQGTVTTQKPRTEVVIASVSNPSVLQSNSQATQAKPKVKGGSLALFFRKVYHLAHVRLRDLCTRLEMEDEELFKMTWTCVEQVILQHTELLKDRHLDQMIMCAIYVMAKVTNQPQSFQNIMKCYRYQPQAQSHVYRSVLLGSRQRHTSGSSDSSRAEASGNSSPVNVEDTINKSDKKAVLMRSSSTLPVPHPNSHPPTPTRMMGSGPTFEFEERGDLIQFYNQIFVTKIRNFAKKFSGGSQNGDAPPLSPLPTIRCHTTSPRRVSSKHSVYISPHKTPSLKASPRTEQKMVYCVNRSPAKSLRLINNMIRLKSEHKLEYSGKRQLQVDETEDTDAPPPKRMSLLKRLQDLNSDRQEQASKVVVVS